MTTTTTTTNKTTPNKKPSALHDGYTISRFSDGQHVLVDVATQTRYRFVQNVYNIWYVEEETDETTETSLNGDNVTSEFIEEPVHQGQDDLVCCIWTHKKDPVFRQDSNPDCVESVPSQHFQRALSDASDNIVVDFHQSARQFDEWEPQTAGERRYKRMVESIEHQAKRARRD